MRFKQISAEQVPARRSAFLKKFQGALSERPIEPIEIEPSALRRRTRRDVLLFGAGALATLAVGGSQLPSTVLGDWVAAAAPAPALTVEPQNCQGAVCRDEPPKTESSG